MSVLDRFGKVVKSEWNHRFGRGDDDKDAARDAAKELRDEKPRSGAPVRKPRVADVEGALRVLELGTSSGQTPVTLDEVRARYRELSRRYHPKTGSGTADEAHAAQVVLEALTDALELLEEHLLPLPPSPSSQNRPG